MKKAKKVLGEINDVMGISEGMAWQYPDGKITNPTAPYAVLAKDRPPKSGEYYYMETGNIKWDPSMNSPKIRVAQTFGRQSDAADWAAEMNMPPGTHNSKVSRGIYWWVSVRGRLLKMK